MISSVIYAFIWLAKSDMNKLKYASKKNFKGYSDKDVVISLVVCGIDRTEEAFVVVKSALVFSSTDHNLLFLIVTEDSLFSVFHEKVCAIYVNFKLNTF